MPDLTGLMDVSLTTVSLLAFQYVNRRYAVYTDANDSCIGAYSTHLPDKEEDIFLYSLSHKSYQTQTRCSIIHEDVYAIFLHTRSLLSLKTTSPKVSTR